jgi:hypothetical protein
MNTRRLSVAIAEAALVSAAAGGAWAGDKPHKPVDFTVKSEPVAPVSITPNAGRIMKWDASKGRFGVTLDMQQPSERPLAPNDIAAGAYYRITPSLRVGGSVALGAQELTPRANTAPPASTPKVRVETKFRF